MMMDRRKRFLIFLGIMAIVIFLLIWFLWMLFGKKEPVVVIEEPVDTQPVVIAEEPQGSPIEQQQRDGRLQAAHINALAKTFTERYGSYSNEAQFQNLKDVMPLMTASFAEETEAFIATAVIPSGYYGISTRVISVETIALDETAGTATFELMTQREEATVIPTQTTLNYQKIRLEFIKEEEEWRVSSATWQ